MKTVFLTVNEEYVSGAGIIVGAVGTSSSKINVTFSEDWGGLVKYCTTKDSRGQNATVTMLTAEELIEENVYEFDVPGSALSHEGLMSVTFTGFQMQGSEEAENATNTATCKLRVLPSDSVVADDSSITPPIAVQLQSQIESILSDITDARAAATEAAESASSASADAATAFDWRKISQSYAKGGTGRRIGEDTDNAKYYCETAGESATSASASATSASESESAAATSETNANDSAVSAESYAVGGTGSRTGEDTDNAKYYKEQADTDASSASSSATTATTQATKAESFAVGGTSSRTGEDTDNAKYYSEQASASATSASSSATTATTKAGEASASATMARSYTVGDTETRQGEATDNAHYYYEQVKTIAESLNQGLIPSGTLTFANLPSLSVAVTGAMYNVSDEFTTTSDFEEGAGRVIPAGSNIYKTNNNKWDVLAGSPVTGVKGDSELDYRRGNVNITKANIGLGNVDNTSDSAKSTAFGTFTSSDSTTSYSTWENMDKFESASVPTLFEKISKLFKNVRFLKSKTDSNTSRVGSCESRISTVENTTGGIMLSISIQEHGDIEGIFTQVLDEATSVSPTVFYARTYYGAVSDEDLIDKPYRCFANFDEVRQEWTFILDYNNGLYRAIYDGNLLTVNPTADSASVGFTPPTGMSATNVQDAIEEVNGKIPSLSKEVITVTTGTGQMVGNFAIPKSNYPDVKFIIPSAGSTNQTYQIRLFGETSTEWIGDCMSYYNRTWADNITVSFHALVIR